MRPYRLIHADCLEVLPTLEENSVDLIVTDPPYFKIKGEAWDRQWGKPEQFIAWIGRVCEQLQHVLKPNGSLYLFASPRMSARVEVEVGRWFNVLNRIRWVKGDGWHRKADKKALRSYLSPWEEIIFAEHYGADNIAKGEAGYGAKCDELRGFVFEPLRKYLDDERRRAGISFEQVRQIVGCAPGSGLPSHWFNRSQWMLPSADHYAMLQRRFNSNDNGRSPQYLRREYEDLRREYEDLRGEYEDLRGEYEDLRRPFSVTADMPYTDVWDFPTVHHYPGKHPCEKPLAMLEYMVRTSSRERAVVLDPFMGSGTTGMACMLEDRTFIGIDNNAEYIEMAQKRIAPVAMQTALALI